MRSIFSRLYSYRERENRHNKENFLTEILAFCMENDEYFRLAFFQLLGVESIYGIPRVNTQAAYPDLGRPDIELTCGDHHLLIECKIEHYERENQLADYRQILQRSEFRYKHLVYLTKYYGEKHHGKSKISFKALRWHQIYALIQPNHHPFTIQLQTYLKEERMDKSNNFNYFDLTALQTISGTISKMDEVLNEAKNYFKLHSGLGRFRDSTRSAAILPQQSYRDYMELTDNEGYSLWLNMGFFWNGDNDEVSLCLHFWLDKVRDEQKAAAYAEAFKRTLPDLKLSPSDQGVWIGFDRSLSTFFGEPNQIAAMVGQLKDWIDLFRKLSEEHSEKFGISRN